MFRAVLNWVTARLGSDGEGDDESEESRFVPSALDWSVRYSHGGGNAEAEREIAAVEEQARQLEEHQREQ